MQLHRRLGRPEPRPGEHRQAQVDDGGVERIHGLIQHRGKTAVVGIQEARAMDQPLREVGIDPPVPAFVGVRQGRASNRAPEPAVVELARLRLETGLDVAQALPPGQLRKRHGPILLRTPQGPNATVPLIADHNPLEGGPRQEIHRLSKKGSSRHGRSSAGNDHHEPCPGTHSPTELGKIDTNRNHPQPTDHKDFFEKILRLNRTLVMMCHVSVHGPGRPVAGGARLSRA